MPGNDASANGSYHRLTARRPMCGIAGFVGPWSDTLLDGMIDALRHRGPDGEGRYRDRDGNAALGHTRLAIIDLSEAAAQPMATPDGRFVISFNGEIYNYRALRESLTAQGEVFRSHGDTEVLLRLFAREGLAGLDRVQGIFAFAVWDRDARRLTLCRDHMGVKPLYYAALTDGILFASEAKALTLCRDVPRDIDPAAVADHLGFLWTAGEATVLRAVRKLRPGCALIADQNGVRTERYYRVPVPAAKGGGRHMDPEELRALIDTVVRDQMVADVEVGALLSGGVDSSAIVASMCQATDAARITTFCATVSADDNGADNFGDDRNYANAVAARLGVGNIDVPTEADLIDALPDMVWALDEPTADFAAQQTLILARAARTKGIKVLLSGVGGDDLFTGYGRHRAALVYEMLGRVPGLRRLAAAILGALPVGGVAGRRIDRVAALIAQDENSMLSEAMSFSAVGVDRRAGLLSPGIRDAAPKDGIPEAFARSLADTNGRDPVTRFLDLELNGFLPDHNLNYTDKMAMRAGVEVRVPLVDTRLVDCAMAMPTADKIDLRTTKKILRQSQRGRVPDDVLTRSKQGFGVPVRAWLHGPARDMMEDLTAPAVLNARGLFDSDSVASLRGDFLAGRIDAAMTLFPIMAVELWCRALDRAPTVS